MFNIVKKRDFMLADDLPTAHEAELLRIEKYGREYIVVFHASPENQKQLAAFMAAPRTG